MKEKDILFYKNVQMEMESEMNHQEHIQLS